MKLEKNKIMFLFMQINNEEKNVPLWGDKLILEILCHSKMTQNRCKIPIHLSIHHQSNPPIHSFGKHLKVQTVHLALL